jgi:addiction module HigA family antidote
MSISPTLVGLRWVCIIAFTDKEDVLLPLGLDVTEVARRLGMSRTTLSRVIHEHAGVSPNLAIRLEQAGVSSAHFWVTLQANYELSQAWRRKQPKVEQLQPVA